jgi:hypothetical protein
VPVAVSIRRGEYQMDDGHAFDSRVEALRERGFEVAEPTGDLASQEMLYIEEQAELASKIKSMVLDLPPHREEEKQAFLTRLINPLQAASVEIEVRQFLRQNRPWVLLAERARGRWSEEGRSVELVRLLERLDMVDDAVVLGSPRILSMIEDASPKKEIEPIMTEIERRNSDRLQALQGMIQMLAERGWDVSSLHQGTIYERFDEAERIHSLDDILSRCQRKIENVIRPFGHNIAERLWGAVTSAQKLGNEVVLSEVEIEIDAVIVDLNQRFEAVEARIASWQSEGFRVEAQLPLLAGEMIAWEVKLPSIAEKIEATHAIWSQMEVHLVQWPEYRRLAERTRGHLGAIESLDVLLQGLMSKTDGAREACKNRLELWSSFGIDISPWAALIDSEPRAVLEELNTHQPFIDLVIPLIEELQGLDTSIDGSTKVVELLANLRGVNPGLHDVELTKDWLELALNRRKRHRSYLDRARIDLATIWPADLDPNSLDLAQYEQSITELETHGMISSERGVVRSETDERLGRLIEGLKEEIDDWRFVGWSVNGLLEMLAQDPVKLGLDLPEIRAAMSSHDARVARFSPLPWALDVELAERVLSELRRPECLVGLDAEFQDLMHALAGAEGVGDPDFEFEPFLPSNPISTIEKRLPVLVPIVKEFDDKQAELEVPQQEIIHEEITVITEDVDQQSESLYDEDEVDSEMEDAPLVPVVEPSRDALKLLGIGADDSWAEMMLPPLDVRVQRLGRLALIVDGGPDEFKARLSRIAKRLEGWTVERLTGRLASSGNGLLKDAKALGLLLADIPGPGVALPLSKDVYPLPDVNDVQGLQIAIDRLESAVMLPSATIQVAEAVES